MVEALLMWLRLMNQLNRWWCQYKTTKNQNANCAKISNFWLLICQRVSHWINPDRLLFSIAKNVISDSLSKNYRNLLISTSHGHPIIKTKETGYLMCFLDALGLADICQQANHQHRQHFNMIPYDLQNLWLSWTYGRPDLMIVLILWLSTSYDCLDLMVVHILWLSVSYDCPKLLCVIFQILWLSISYGCPLERVTFGWKWKFKLLQANMDVCHTQEQQIFRFRVFYVTICQLILTFVLNKFTMWKWPQNGWKIAVFAYSFITPPVYIEMMP